MLFNQYFLGLKKLSYLKKFADWLERKLKRKSENIENKTDVQENSKKKLWIKILGVFCFVAIPLPLTGVWTGTCLALFIGLNRKQTMLSVLSGNAVAGGTDDANFLLFCRQHFYCFIWILVLVVIFVLYEIIKSLVLKTQN